MIGIIPDFSGAVNGKAPRLWVWPQFAGLPQNHLRPGNNLLWSIGSGGYLE
jgi:hypothetical protein